jgi:S1-C subfamily serine protease
MDDSPLPPVKRRPIPVPPPPPPDAPGGPSVLPADGAPPLATGALDRGIPLDQPATAFPETGAVHRRVPRRGEFPRWAWGALAGGGMLTLIGFMVFVYSQPDTKKPAENTLDAALAKLHDGKTAESAAKTASKTATAAKTAEETPADAPATSGKTAPESKPKPDAKTAHERDGGPAAARSLDEAQEALVRIEGPAIGMQIAASGQGFFINARGWIAVNLTAVEDATTATRAVLANGDRCELAGLVAKDEQRGLAIVKLREPPKRLAYLDIAAPGEPQKGDRLFLVGHPYRADFIFAPAAVSAVIKTTDLPQGVKRAVAGAYAPREASWIEHAAKTSAAANGCPLVNEDGKAVGINRPSGAPDGRGYAMPVRYLRTLAETGSEDAVPLPKGPSGSELTGPLQPKPQEPPEMVEPAPVEPDPAPAAPDERVELSQGRMKEFYEQAAAAGWKPQRAAQYAPISGLARLMTFAKLQKDQAGTRLNLLPQGIQDAVAYADEVSQTLRKTAFDVEQVRAINRFAAEQLDQPNTGVLLFANVLQTVREGQQGKDAVIAEVMGTQKLVGFFPGAEAPPTPSGTRLLILAVVRPQAAELQDQEGKRQRISLLQANYLLPVK